MAAKKKRVAKAKPAAGVAELLARVLAAPEDLELAAVYADALIEAGDPRGTFNAEQLAIASMSPLDIRYAPLLASTRRAEAEHGAAWIGDYLERSNLAETHGSVRTGLDRLLNAVFEGGFLRRIAITCELIAKEWPRLRAREPVTGMEVLVGEGFDQAHRALREPKALTSLKVSPDGWFTASTVGNILAWGMPHLRSLDLSGCDLGIDGARIIANEKPDLSAFEGYVAPPPFAEGQLRRLILRTTQLQEAGARIVLGATHLSKLEELDISQCRISDASILEALRDAPALRGITRLALAGNQGFGPGLGALAGWPALAQLTALTLPQTTTADALRELFPKPAPALHTLDVASAKELLTTPDAIVRAAEALAFLDLGTTSIGDAGLRTLLAAKTLRPLVQLAANGCSLSDDAVTALTSSKLDRLVALDLSSNKLTDRALSTLAGWPGIAQITNLRLGNNRKLSAAGYSALVEAPSFRPAVLDVGKIDGKLRERLEERFGVALVARG